MHETRDRLAQWIVEHPASFAASHWAAACRKRGRGPPRGGFRTLADATRWIETAPGLFPHRYTAMLDMLRQHCFLPHLTPHLFFHVGTFLTLEQYAGTLACVCRAVRTLVRRTDNPPVHTLNRPNKDQLWISVPSFVPPLVRTLAMRPGHFHPRALRTQFPRLQTVSFSPHFSAAQLGFPLYYTGLPVQSIGPSENRFAVGFRQTVDKGYTFAVPQRPGEGQTFVHRLLLESVYLQCDHQKAFCDYHVCPWCPDSTDEDYGPVYSLPAEDVHKPVSSLPTEDVCELLLPYPPHTPAPLPRGLVRLTRLATAMDKLPALRILWAEGEMPNLNRLEVFDSSDSVKQSLPMGISSFSWPRGLTSLSISCVWGSILDLTPCRSLCELTLLSFYVGRVYLPPSLTALFTDAVHHSRTSASLDLPSSVTCLGLPVVGLTVINNPLGWLPAPVGQPLRILDITFRGLTGPLLFETMLHSYPLLTSCTLHLEDADYHTLDLADIFADLIVRYIRRHRDRTVSISMTMGYWRWSVATPDFLLQDDPATDPLDEFLQLFRWGCNQHGYAKNCPCLYSCRKPISARYDFVSAVGYVTRRSCCCIQ